MLVDDHAVVRTRFKILLNTIDDLRLVANCGTGEDALRRFPEIRPDVKVFNLSMDGMGSLDTSSRLLAKYPEPRVLMLSSHKDTAQPRRALTTGSFGYVTKRSEAEALVEAIRHVEPGERFIEPAVARDIALEQVDAPRTPVEALSGREFEVFVMLARGNSVAEIAKVLFVSPRTVGAHLYNIKQKLHAANASELTLIAIRNDLIDV